MSTHCASGSTLLVVVLALGLGLAPLSAHAAARHQRPTPPVAAIPPHRIFALNKQGAAAPLSFDQLMAELGQADVIICGEYHDDPATHKMELGLFRGLIEQDHRIHPERRRADGGFDPPRLGLALSMEMFERDVQRKLSTYVLANPVAALTQKEFLASTRPWPNYQSDYRPLIELAKEYAIPVLAANAPTALARRVGHEGWSAVEPALGPEERPWVAASTSSPDDQYWKRFLEFMGGSGGNSHGSGMTEEQIRHFYEAQCLKDDTMAETIVAYSSSFIHTADMWGATPRQFSLHSPVFQVNGSFHSDYGLGVAQRVRQRFMAEAQQGSMGRAGRAYTVAIRPTPDFTPVSDGGSLDPQGETLADGTPVADFVIFVPAPKKTRDSQ